MSGETRHSIVRRDSLPGEPTSVLMPDAAGMGEGLASEATVDGTPAWAPEEPVTMERGLAASAEPTPPTGDVTDVDPEKAAHSESGDFAGAPATALEDQAGLVDVEGLPMPTAPGESLSGPASDGTNGPDVSQEAIGVAGTDAPPASAGKRRSRGGPTAAKAPKDEAAEYGVFDPVRFDACLGQLQALEGEGLLTDLKRGEHLAELKASSGDKTRFETTLKARYGMTDKHARNLIGVRARFFDERDRWAAIGVSASHLRRLTTSPQELVETIYAEFAASGVTSTAALDERLRDLKGSGRTQAAAGGAALAKARLAEFRSVARSTADANVGDLQDAVAELVGILEKGLTLHRDGVSVSIRRTALSKAALRPARCAARILECTFTRFVPGPAFDGVSHYARITTDVEELRAVRAVLHLLCKVERWPKENAARWLQSVVLPILRWAIGRDPIEPLAIDAILDAALKDSEQSGHFPADYAEVRKAKIRIDPQTPASGD